MDTGGRWLVSNSRSDSDGDMWHENWPIMMISWYAANHYAQWKSQKDNVLWSLPSPEQWEKSARGVDGRLFPWGDFCDPAWCLIRESHEKTSQPAEIQEYPLDISPYGVRGMGGNCRDLTKELGKDKKRVIVCGGSWWTSERYARICGRHTFTLSDRVGNVSFRLIREIPTTEP